MWWSGKGYLTAVILLAILALFGLALPAAGELLPDTNWYWGMALMFAAVVNWLTGRRVNARTLRRVQSDHVADRLLYRARHKFLTLPLEIWSIPMGIAGLAAILYDMARA